MDHITLLCYQHGSMAGLSGQTYLACTKNKILGPGTWMVFMMTEAIHEFWSDVCSVLAFYFLDVHCHMHWYLVPRVSS